MDDDIDRILDYWFGELTPDGLCRESKNSLWFSGATEVDEQCREMFGDLVTSAVRGDLTHWRDTPRGLVALIVLLDQFTRNIYRGTPAAFSGDSLALELALDAVESGAHSEQPPIYRVFLYLPFEHSESMEIQEHSVGLYRALDETSSGVREAGYTRYAIAHRDVIARFGRFPHRNIILGRTSSTEELDYLETHGGF